MVKPSWSGAGDRRGNDRATSPKVFLHRRCVEMERNRALIRFDDSSAGGWKNLIEETLGQSEYITTSWINRHTLIIEEGRGPVEVFDEDQTLVMEDGTKIEPYDELHRAKDAEVLVVIGVQEPNAGVICYSIDRHEYTFRTAEMLKDDLREHEDREQYFELVKAA